MLDNNLIQSCIVNLNKTFRNSGDIELLSNLIFNNENSLFQKKIKELANQNNSKVITETILERNKNDPLLLIAPTGDNLSQENEFELNEFKDVEIAILLGISSSKIKKKLKIKLGL